MAARTREASSTVKPRPDLLRRLLRAKDRMDAPPDQDWPIPRLAELSAVSPAHFARGFKQAFGLPPHRYLLTRRIERAAALLRDTDAPVIDIALQTGWRSIGTFGRIFRDITGESPGRKPRACAQRPGHPRRHARVRGARGGTSGPEERSSGEAPAGARD